MRGTLISMPLLLLVACGEPTTNHDAQGLDTDLSNDDAGAPLALTNDEASAKLVELGFNEDSIEFDGNVIRIEGDVILRRDLLAQNAYARVQDMKKDGSINKGYRRSSVVTDPYVYETQLIWATGSTAPSTTIKNAFITAAGDFNSINSSVYLSQNNPGPWTLKVSVIGEANWPGSSGCSASSLGCADYPAAGRVGANVYLKASGITAKCPTWSASVLANRVRHELAHAYGLMHPRDSGSTHIFSTEECTGKATECQQNPGYPTVMRKNAVVNGTTCATGPTVLQTDDRASIDYMY
jgi:hypothetical protein